MIETPKARVWIEGNICRVAMAEGSDIQVEDLHTIREAEIELMGGKKYPVLINMSQVHSSTREAREYGVSPDFEQIVTAVALIIHSPISRVLGNIFINFNRPPYPTGLFTEEADAIKWLTPYVEANHGKE